MRTPQKAIGFTIATAAVIALAGCVQNPTHVIPTADPTVAPVFASDADALAAAKTTYLAYSRASDAIGADGGKNPLRIANLVTRDDLATETTVFDSFSKTGERLIGSSVISHFQLQEVDQSRNGIVTLTAYACDDVSASRLISKSGIDVTPVNRQEIVPLQVHFKNARSGSKVLLVNGSERWSGKNFCS